MNGVSRERPGGAELLTKCENKRGFLIKARVVLVELTQPIGDRGLVDCIFRVIALRFPSSLKLLNRGESAPQRWLSLG
jgi:hypothetical protein